MKLWKRYFILETLNVFLLFIGVFFILYAVLDYSVHSKTLTTQCVSIAEIAHYYGSQLSKRLEILMPFALMVAVIKVLTTLNQRNELVALLAAGTPIHQLMKPFLGMAVACACLLCANFEWIYPQAVPYVDRFEDTYLHQVKPKAKSSLQVLRLLDNSHVVYGQYDTETESIRDAYWLCGTGEIYRMGELRPFDSPPTARDVEVLARTKAGKMERTSTHQSLSLEEMRFDDEALSASFTTPDSLSLSKLIERFPKTGKPLSDNEAAIVTHLSCKLSLPLLCLLVVIGPAPSCLRYGRHLPVFLIYCIAVVGFLTALAIRNAAIILGEHQVVNPLFAIGGSLLLALGITTWRFAKLPGS